MTRWLTGETRAQRSGEEADVEPDPGQPNDSNTFVGRPSGDDPGYAGETGAERRAWDGGESPAQPT